MPTVGARGEGRPEPRAELRSGVGPAHSIAEALEGDVVAEGVEGRGWREGSPRERATVRTESRGIVLPHLRRVYEAARRDKHARFTALLHHVAVRALTRALRTSWSRVRWPRCSMPSTGSTSSASPTGSDGGGVRTRRSRHRTRH